ncbi:MAG: hypothetical protein AVDCRST_MAG31-1884 [uncultured Sphingomonas sp.]|uniref:Glycosyltransferase RgtA/B/C/D-like domain-containing protein n=1 Tax=uncultured Sphingomonas sp. TaxID=158754 RepID=A0A6J4TJY1_9SPHN|nr:hypothetical protein [uncultured Sphingomonas sp.]CAA9525417.1 MAG: hypothetical protein AVDCRST_MAG31-1884 [uncultured Sphingomonas sp.]
MIPVAADSWQSGRRSASLPATVAAMLVAAVLTQSLLTPVNADVSWLITLCERLLGGDRLYVDIIEANPPASVWLYLPTVWLAQRLALAPEPLVIGSALLGAVASIAATGVLAAKLRGLPSGWWLMTGAGFALLILPGALFAQREHFALMLALPATAAIVRIAERRTPNPAVLAAAGIAAGLLMAIKPPFALALLLPALWAAVRVHGWRPFFFPAAAAALVLAAYAAAVVLVTPDYLQLLPMLGATYLPMRDRPLNFLLGPMLVVPVALYLLGRVAGAERTPPLATALFLASAGFALAGLMQGKNYLNHSYPGIALAVVALAVLLAERTAAPASRRLAIAAAALLIGLQLFRAMSVQPPPGLVEAIARAGPAKPRLMTLGTELATGHPAARLAGGRWVGSRPSLFTAAAARYVGLRDPAVRRWYREDLASFVRDVDARRPDLVLVEDRSRSWLLADPAIRRAMARYRPVTRAGTVEVWRRR